VPSRIPLGSWLCSQSLFRELGLSQRFHVLRLIKTTQEPRQALVEVWPSYRRLTLDVPKDVVLPDDPKRDLRRRYWRERKDG
jgi:hypothetical protein